MAAPSGSRARRLPRVSTSAESLERRQLLATVPALTAYLAPASDPDGNGVVLNSSVVIGGRTLPGSVIAVVDQSGGRVLRFAWADANGWYAAPIALPVGRDALTVVAATPAGTASLGLVVKRGDVLIDFNTQVLNAIRSDNTGPPQAARALAMVQIAAYDAVEAADGGRDTYGPTIAALRGASDVAAAAVAADIVATSLFPDRASTFDAALREALATVGRPGALWAGVAVGQRAAVDILALRANDGSNAPSTYVPGTAPGDWVPTPPKNAAALGPQYKNVTPFALASPGQFLPAAPPALNSAQYAAEFYQVEALGSATSTIRTPAETASAKFWSDLQGTTFTPPGHWNQIAQDAAMSSRMGLLQEARLFAQLDGALADAGIACWNAKYTYNTWRPITAIREANLDGNTATVADPTWTPLWATPPFPSYVSGHSAFSSAAAVVLTSYFGSNYAFTDYGDPRLGLAPETFTSFADAAQQAGFSRIVGGIHFWSDNVAGLALGQEVGSYVMQHLLTK